MGNIFHRFSEVVAKAVGSSWAFIIAVVVVLAWAVTGPMFHYSDTWQLLINTGTTVVTFLMVFVIQNSQNRDSCVVALKLDELLRSVEGARTELVGLDHMSDEELEQMQEQFRQMEGKTGSLLQDDIRVIGRELQNRREKTSPRSANASRNH
ncbi:MAG: low affinity iron permease family protein [Hyphomicrobiaceae bacterium]